MEPQEKDEARPARPPDVDAVTYEHSNTGSADGDTHSTSGYVNRAVGNGGVVSRATGSEAPLVMVPTTPTLTPPQPQFGGSRKGRAANVERDHKARATRLFRDYFAASSPTCGSNLFRRKFRMRQHVFLRIARGVLQVDDSFVLKFNAVNQPGLSTFQKVALVLRILFHGKTSDACDAYVQAGDSTCSHWLNQFCAAVSERFGAEYLHAPAVLGVDQVLDEKAGERMNPRECFAAIQSAVIEDVERGFALLEKRFAIVKNPPRAWSTSRLHAIMSTCVILHNMIMEDERGESELLGDLNFEDANGGGGGPESGVQSGMSSADPRSPKRRRILEPWADDSDENVNSSDDHSDGNSNSTA